MMRSISSRLQSLFGKRRPAFVLPRRENRSLDILTLESRVVPSATPWGPQLPESIASAMAASEYSYHPLSALPASATGAATDFQLKAFLPLSLDLESLEQSLSAAPRSNVASPPTPITFAVVKPDGTFAHFRLWESETMEPGLAARFPDIHTYAGQGIEDPAATIAADVTYAGFHASVRSPNGSYYIDPYYHLDTSVYASYNRSDLLNSHPFGCQCPMCQAAADIKPNDDASDSTRTAYRASNNTTLRTFRAAVAATGEYTAFQGGTVALGQSAIVTAMVRVNQVYEGELSIHMTLVANNSSLVYTDSTTDPYTNSNANTLLTQNQTNCDSLIGTANYDIGHVFSTGGGGLAGLGVVGNAARKAQGETGSSAPTGDAFYIDYVVHEMGHQFGGNHTFNGVNGSAAGNRAASAAYEPGSGSTIMAYAGICGVDDIQAHSDPVFHFKSLDEITNYIDTIASTGTSTATNNAAPTANAGPDYTIPYNTPFLLTGSGSDSNGDALSYDWEQYDLGAAAALGTTESTDGGTLPLYRSFAPVTNTTRSIPTLTSVLAGTWSKYEVADSTARALNFKLTVRDNHALDGAYNSDATVITTVNTGSNFAITNLNAAGTSFAGFTPQLITWNIAGTTGNGINAASVNILLSTDGGLTFPATLANATLNDGSESIVIPNTVTSTARIKIQPVNNIFYDINDANFSITNGSTMFVNSTTPANNGVIGGPTATLDITFSSPVAPGSVGTNDLTLNAGSVTSAVVQSANVVRYTIAGLTTEGTLNVSLPSGAVTDTNNQPVSAFLGIYSIDFASLSLTTPLTALGQVGSRVYSGTASGLVNAAGDTDSFTVTLDAGQTLSAVLTPAAGLQPTISVTGPGGTLGTTTASATGAKAVLTALPVATAGTYTVTVGSASSTAGSYSLQVLLNSSPEAETQLGASNDSIATAQNIDAAFTTLGGVATTAVSGRTEAAVAIVAAETEANNTTATANSLVNNFTASSGNVYHMSITGTMASATDVDYYSIGAMQVGDVLTITQSGSPSSRGTLTDSIVTLYRFNAGAFTSVATSDDEGPGRDSLIYQQSITTADTYYVAASQYSTGTGSSYQLGLYLENSGAAPTTGGTLTAEAEPNSTGAMANDASSSWRAAQYATTVTASITASDTDTYRFTLNSGDLLSLAARSTSTLDAQIKLLNSAGTVIASENGSSTTLAPANGAILSSPLNAFPIPASGTYYVQVLSSASTTGTYSLDAFLSANVAPPLAGNGTDNFAFTLTNSQSVGLTLKGASAGTFALDVLNSAGAVVGTSTAGATNFDRGVAGYTATAAGTYYARVSGTAGIDYTFAIAKNATFDREANDTFGTAQILTSGQNAVGAISGNDDWYAVTIPAGNSLVLGTATPGDGPGEFANALDPRIEVYDSTNALVASADNNAADGRNAALLYTPAAAGTFYIRVTSAAATSGEYVLTPTVTTNPPPIVTGYVVNDGNIQRSRVGSIRVNFSEPVSFVGAAAAAFVVAGPLGNVTTNPVLDASGLFVTINFTSNVTFGSLDDGGYSLTVVPAQIVDATSQSLPTWGANAFAFHRLSGDQDGDRDVDLTDLGQFRANFLAVSSDPATPPYNVAFDFDIDGDIDLSDLSEFRSRFGIVLP